MAVSALAHPPAPARAALAGLMKEGGSDFRKKYKLAVRTVLRATQNNQTTSWRTAANEVSRRAYGDWRMISALGAESELKELVKGTVEQLARPRNKERARFWNKGPG